MRLDEIKRKLIAILQENGRASLVEIGRELGMTHVGVRKHLIKLLSSGLVKIQALLNAEMLGIALALIILTNVTRELDCESLLENCPRVLEVYYCSDSTVHMIVVGENKQVLDCVVKRFRHLFQAYKPVIIIVDKLLKPKFLPLKISTRNREVSPCGTLCPDCDMYEKPCTGCPSTVHYRGAL